LEEKETRERKRKKKMVKEREQDGRGEEKTEMAELGVMREAGGQSL
jgi:hypothetical protein